MTVRNRLIRQRSSKGIGIVSHQFICIVHGVTKAEKVNPYIDISSLQPVCSGKLRRSLFGQRIFILRPRSKTMSYRCVECIICTSIKQIKFWSFLYVFRQCAKPFWLNQQIVWRYLPQLFHFQIEIGTLVLTGCTFLSTFLFHFTFICVVPSRGHPLSPSSVNMQISKEAPVIQLSTFRSQCHSRSML